ncbi:MAG: hypothetical protein KatS3mg015_2817 [Fimbriimonadales bacterium]|nr:MAG: hypothetical protein KatS3mg015_2817 [Fimbriimonadales bacterium]
MPPSREIFDPPPRREILDAHDRQQPTRRKKPRPKTVKVTVASVSREPERGRPPAIKGRPSERPKTPFLWGVPESIGRAVAALGVASAGGSSILPFDIPTNIISPFPFIPKKPLISKKKQQELIKGLIGDDDLARDWIIGPETYKKLAGQKYNPYLQAAEAASWFLGTGVSKAGFAAARAPVVFGIVGGRQAVKGGVRAGVRAGAKAAVEETKKGSAILRGAKHLGRSAKKHWRDPLKSHQLGFRTPAAKSALGRAMENAIDAVSTEGMKMRRAAKNLRQTEAILRGLDAGDVVELKRYAKKMPIEEVYAIRALAANVSPDERALFHKKQFELTDNVLEKYAHSVHADLNELASKYVTTVGDDVVLRADAPERLKRAWELYLRVYKKRERILADLDVLLDETMAERINATGKIMKGAEWIENEVWVQQAIQNNPKRKQIADVLEEMVERQMVTRQEASDLLAVIDAQARAWLQREEKYRKNRIKALERRLNKLYEEADDASLGTDIEARINRVEEELNLLSGPVDVDDYFSQLHNTKLGIDPKRVAEITRDLDESFKVRFFEKAPEDLTRNVARREFNRARRWASSAKSRKNYLPRGYRTIAKFTELVDELYRRAVEGLPYARNWYRDSGAAILRHAGGDIDKADQLAALTAIYSPQQSVIPNIGLALRAWEEYIITGAITLGEEHQRRRAMMVMEGLDWLGDLKPDQAIKVRNFYGNLLKHTDIDRMRARGFTGREVTSDGWMGAAFKYGSNTDSMSLNANQHRLIERVTQDIADALGVEPEEAQAAIWASIKASNDVRLNKLPREEALARAGVNFEAGLTRTEHQLRIAFEAASDSIPEYATWPPEVQQAFLEANAIAVEDTFRKHGIYSHVGDYGIGTWIDDTENVQTNPAAALFVNIGNLRKGDYSMRQESIAFADGLAAVIGKNLLQDSVGWMRPMVPTSSKVITYYRINGNFTVEQRKAFARAIAGSGYVTQTTDGIMAVRLDPESVLDNGVSPDDFANKVAKAGKEILGENVTLTGGTHRGGYLAGQEAYGLAIEHGRRALDASGRSDLLGRLDSGLAREAERIRRAFIDDPIRAAREVAQDPRRTGLSTSGRSGADDVADVTVKASSSSRIPGGGYASRIPREEPANPAWREPNTRYIGGITSTKRIGPHARTEVQISERLGDAQIVGHEFFHYLEEVAPRELRILRRYLGDDPEDVVAAWETWVIMGGGGKKELSEVFARLSNVFSRQLRGKGESVTARPALPRRVIELFDALHDWDNLKGGALRGAEHTGRAKEPFQRGLPLPLRKDLRNWKMYVRFARSGRGAIGKMWSDPTTKKAMKGILLKSGFFKADVLSAAAEEAMKAVKLASVARVRRAMLSMSTDLPKDARAIAIKINPDKRVSPALSRYQDLIDSIDEGMDISEALARHGVKKEKLFGREQLRQLENSQLDAFLDELFPAGPEIDDLKAAMLRGDQGAIENIRWVDPDLLGRSELFDPPNLRRLRMDAWSKLAKTGVLTADILQDFMKVTLLYMNPAYYPMNLMGNLVMNLTQQGVFMPLNLALAAKANWDLPLGYAQIIDGLMGRGFSGTLQLRALAGKPSLAMNDVANILVDRIPRRAAWIHEARRLGYKKSEDIANLIRRAQEGDQAALDDIVYITQQAKNEIVDFDNLSSFERDVLSRIIFVYPWLKGATSYALRFPFNHPVQAAALAFLYQRQQSLANAEVGERPDYLNLYLPLGEVERFGETYPYGINLRQAFTTSTPLDIGKSLTGFITGDYGTSPLTEFAQPIYSTALARITGYDPFLDKKVDRGLLPLVTEVGRQITVDSPLAQGIERIARSDKERRRLAEEGALYPRNRFDDILRTVLGTLASGPVNVETAGRRAREGTAQPAEQEIKDWVASVEKATGEKVPPEIIAIAASKFRYSEIQSEVRKELGTKALGEYGTALSRIYLLWEIQGTKGDKERVKEELKNVDEKTLRRFSDAIAEQLGWNNKAYSVLNRIYEEGR